MSVIRILLTKQFTDILFSINLNDTAICFIWENKIYNQVWKEPYYRAEDNVMSLIRRIRKKIEPDPSKPIYVLTVWGIGYKFNNAIKRK